MKILYSLFKKIPTRVQWWAYHLVNAHFLVGVVAVVEHDGKILLTQATYRQGWALPGGMLKSGEDVAKGLARELEEELDLQVASTAFLCSTTLGAHLLEICLTAQVKNPEITLDNKEVAQARYFGRDELPDRISPSSRTCIERYFSAK